MRVLVATDAIGALSSLDAGTVIGRAFAEHGADVAVVPMGSAGRELPQAVADQIGAEVELSGADDDLVVCVDGDDLVLLGTPAREPAAALPLAATSRPLGEQVARALAGRPRPRMLALDLAGQDVHDGGAGLLAALGAIADVPLDEGAAGLAGLTWLSLAEPHALLEGIDLVGVVPAAERETHLLGLRGITSVRGHASGTVDPAVLLATDQALAQLASAANPETATLPGAGACGGTAQAILALGGRLVSGPELCAELAGLDTTLALADLVVTGAHQLDFVERGGDVVGYFAARGAQQMRPVVVVAGTVAVSARELRTFGIESAYPVHDGLLAGEVSAADLARAAGGVARTWRW